MGKLKHTRNGWEVKLKESVFVLMKYTPSSSQQITIFASKRWSNRTGCLQLFTLTSVAKEKLFTDAKNGYFQNGFYNLC